MTAAKDFIEIYPNALPLAFCEKLIQTHKSHAGVYQGKTGAGVDIEKKNSRDLMLDSHRDLDDLRTELMQYTFQHLKRYFETYTMALCGALSVAVQDERGQSITVTAENFDRVAKDKVGDIIASLYRSGTINIQQYEQTIGGYPHWHSEHFPQTQSSDSLHRVLLYMYYLNDVYEGGETEFFYQKKSIQPKAGTMVIAPAGFTHTHRGNAPVSTDKYIATSWVLFNRAEKIYNKS